MHESIFEILFKIIAGSFSIGMISGIGTVFLIHPGGQKRQEKARKKVVMFCPAEHFVIPWGGCP